MVKAKLHGVRHYPCLAIASVWFVKSWHDKTEVLFLNSTYQAQIRTAFQFQVHGGESSGVHGCFVPVRGLDVLWGCYETHKTLHEFIDNFCCEGVLCRCCEVSRCLRAQDSMSIKRSMKTSATSIMGANFSCKFFKKMLRPLGRWAWISRWLLLQWEVTFHAGLFKALSNQRTQDSMSLKHYWKFQQLYYSKRRIFMQLFQVLRHLIKNMSFSEPHTVQENLTSCNNERLYHAGVSKCWEV